MPLFHFRIAKGEKTVDPKRVELPDAEAAKEHAERLASGLTLLSNGFGIRHLRDWHVQVMDERGNALTRCEVRPIAAARRPRP
jgi:hypothetical protein